MQGKSLDLKRGNDEYKDTYIYVFLRAKTIKIYLFPTRLNHWSFVFTEVKYVLSPFKYSNF